MNLEKFHDNKYSRWYFSIIKKYQLLPNIDGYSELHHILPKSLGGSNLQENLVRVPYKVHFLLHMLLPKMCKSKKDSFKMESAITWMKRPDRNNAPLNSWQYEWMKKSRSKSRKNFIVSEKTKEKQRINFYKQISTPDGHKKLFGWIKEGRIFSTETREKIAKNGFFSKYNGSQEQKEMLKLVQTGRKRSEKTREKISRANKGRLIGDKNPMKTPENQEKLSKAKQGTRWIFNDTIQSCRCVKKELLEPFLNSGWDFGKRSYK